MESFFRTHKYLVEHLGPSIERTLMRQINWNHRLIGIKGTRGVGKTNFILQYARNEFDVNKRDCLYINLNHFYFTVRSIFSFAKEFAENGGKTLLLDQIHKYPNWSKELKQCYNELPELKIIFTGSTVIDLSGDIEISDSVQVYNLRGFSYREFLNILLEKNFRTYSLSEIIENHGQIAEEISSKINPIKRFWDYLHHGYYPFFLEKRNFSENLLKTVNMMLEIDVLSIKQIEHSYLAKLRKLLYMLAIASPGKPNISQLSIDCEISRATVTNYLEYLKGARLINMLYKDGESYPKKPDLVYMHNTNLMFPLKMSTIDYQSLSETFFYNQLHHSDYKVMRGAKKGFFIIEKDGEKFSFRVEGNPTRRKQTKNGSNTLLAVNGLVVSQDQKNVIPLWLLGFLY
mgnify:CR=1 FL=1